MKTVEWVVKASKLCNLRCSYCYEWNSLADPERLDLEAWGRIVMGIRDYHLDVAARLGAVESRVIWHGGEPLLLPEQYLDEVMTMQHEVLSGVPHRLLLQTNLYRVPDRILDLLERQDVGLGVSLDVVSGLRLTRAGGDTREAVLANLDRLVRRGIPHGAITVVARHNHRRLIEVHDFWASRGVNFRVLPLFQGPDERPVGAFEVSDDDLVVALCELFDHWLARGALVDVAPLSEWLVDVLRKQIGLHVPVFDRRRQGERVMLVETNGDLMETDERGLPDQRLGNVVSQSITEIMAGAAYQASLARTEAKAASVCGSCAHHGFCDGYPAHAEPFTVVPGSRCPVTAAVHDHIERQVTAKGYHPDRLLGWLRAESVPA